MASSLLVDLLMRWLKESRKIKMLPVLFSERQRAALASFHLCHEHSWSIAMLLKVGEGRHVSSALALLRPSFEACLRGRWIHRCMTDVTFSRYNTEPYQQLPNKGKLLKDLERIMSPEEYARLCEHAADMQKLHDDFTHGGHQQILRRFAADGTLKHTSSKAEERFVVSRALLYDSMASHWLADLANDEETKKELRSLYSMLDVQSYLLADT